MATSGDGNHTFKDEAEIWYEQVSARTSTTVHLVPVATNSEFRNAWNYKVGYDSHGEKVSIDEVVLIFHGSAENGIGYMYLSNNERITAKYMGYAAGDVHIWSLLSKEMNKLIFSSCNSGNPDIYNVAYAFMLNNTINGDVIAWDGGTLYDYSKKELTSPSYSNWIIERIRQSTWYTYVEKNKYGKPLRKRIGERVLNDIY